MISVPLLRKAVLGCCGLIISAGMSGCVYFNTYYNAQKAFDQAERLHEKRMSKNPEDSVLVTPEEKTKLERSIAKSSKVLELFPDKKKYQPKALFLIGESYLALGEYSKAILKYEELARFYPGAKQIPTADFHRAKAMFLNGQYLVARPALETVVNSSPNPDFRLEAMEYLAKLELADNSPAAALDMYEKLLQSHARTPEARATAHYEAAKLAFDLKQWERARGHAKGKELKHLPTMLRFRSEMLAAECLYRLDRVQEGIGELMTLKKNRLYYKQVPEIDLKLAQGHFMLRQPSRAVDLLTGVPKLAPKTALAAEAFYRLGDYHLRELKDEKGAKAFFDSASVAGSGFEYGILAAERSAALGRLADLRKPADTSAQDSHYRDFMIAELFLFRLETVDSALGHLDRIVEDPRQDSTHTMRAAYARAFIQDEFKEDKSVSDSLYRYVLEKYPHTEYAKQAERNLGLKPSVQTDEDNAHKLFLEAEAIRFGGGDLGAAVIPAYAKVVALYGSTREAAKAQFVIAMVYEQMANGEEKVAGSLDSAISAHQSTRERYAQTPYGMASDTKLAAAGIKPRPKGPVQSANPAAVPSAPASSSGAPALGAPSAPAPGAPSAPAPAAGAASTTAPGTPADPASNTPVTVPAPAVPAAGVPAAGASSHESMRGGRPATETTPPPSETAPAADTASSAPEGKTKEELDTDYENVDQY